MIQGLDDDTLQDDMIWEMIPLIDYRMIPLIDESITPDVSD